MTPGRCTTQGNVWGHVHVQLGYGLLGNFWMCSPCTSELHIEITSLDASPDAKLVLPLAMQLVCARSVSCLQQGAMYVVIGGVVGAVAEERRCPYNNSQHVFHEDSV